MPDFSVLILFIPTFFFVSITPGMCMTLALTLGIKFGYRKTLYMMYGELLGVGLVAFSSVLGVAGILLNYPNLFIVLKFFGAGYLAYLGIQMWRAQGNMAITQVTLEQSQQVSKKLLFSQGLITAIANPKGWAFMISLLPPFINNDLPLIPQLTALVFIILCSEFISMSIYALGGKGLQQILSKGKNVALLNRISGTLMISVGVWLLAS
jgi:threonine/homoserine/homoserine lactone efflux protein